MRYFHQTQDSLTVKSKSAPWQLIGSVSVVRQRLTVDRGIHLCELLLKKLRQGWLVSRHKQLIHVTKEQIA